MADSDGGTLVANPFDVVARPAMPCDLCEIFKIGVGRDGPKSVTMALPYPPFWPEPRGDGSADIHAMQTVKVTARKVEFEFYSVPQESRDADSLVSQATQALCTEALHSANMEVMDTLHGIQPSSIGEHDVDSLLHCAAEMCATYPYPQFPLGAAFLLPSLALGRLMDTPNAHVHIDSASRVSHAFVGGVETIAYADPLGEPSEDGKKMPEYVLPRRGGIGLAMSDVAVWADWVGQDLHFRSHFYVGASIISQNIFSLIP